MALVRITVGRDPHQPRVFEVDPSAVWSRDGTFLAGWLDRNNMRAHDDEVIDRDPNLFEAMLGWYAGGKITIPSLTALPEIEREADFHCIPLRFDTIKGPDLGTTLELRHVVDLSRTLRAEVIPLFMSQVGNTDWSTQVRLHTPYIKRPTVGDDVYVFDEGCRSFTDATRTGKICKDDHDQAPYTLQGDYHVAYKEKNVRLKDLVFGRSDVPNAKLDDWNKEVRLLGKLCGAPNDLLFMDIGKAGANGEECTEDIEESRAKVHELALTLEAYPFCFRTATTFKTKEVDYGTTRRARIHRYGHIDLHIEFTGDAPVGSEARRLWDSLQERRREAEQCYVARHTDEVLKKVQLAADDPVQLRRGSIFHQLLPMPWDASPSMTVRAALAERLSHEGLEVARGTDSSAPVIVHFRRGLKRPLGGNRERSIGSARERSMGKM